MSTDAIYYRNTMTTQTSDAKDPSQVLNYLWRKCKFEMFLFGGYDNYLKKDNNGDIILFSNYCYGFMQLNLTKMTCTPEQLYSFDNANMRCGNPDQSLADLSKTDYTFDLFVKYMLAITTISGEYGDDNLSFTYNPDTKKCEIRGCLCWSSGANGRAVINTHNHEFMQPKTFYYADVRHKFEQLSNNLNSPVVFIFGAPGCI